MTIDGIVFNITFCKCYREKAWLVLRSKTLVELWYGRAIMSVSEICFYIW